MRDKPIEMYKIDKANIGIHKEMERINKEIEKAFMVPRWILEIMHRRDCIRLGISPNPNTQKA